MDLEYGTMKDDRCKSKTMSMGIWEKHAFTNQNLMEHRQSMIAGMYLTVQNIEALHSSYISSSFRFRRFGLASLYLLFVVVSMFCLCSV